MKNKKLSNWFGYILCLILVLSAGLQADVKLIVGLEKDQSIGQVNAQAKHKPQRTRRLRVNNSSQAIDKVKQIIDAKKIGPHRALSGQRRTQGSKSDQHRNLGSKSGQRRSKGAKSDNRQTQASKKIKKRPHPRLVMSLPSNTPDIETLISNLEAIEGVAFVQQDRKYTLRPVPGRKKRHSKRQPSPNIVKPLGISNHLSFHTSLTAMAALSDFSNDPSLSLQWALDETDAEDIWEITTGHSDQVIAIIDTGTDILHPDLADNIWVNSNEIANNGVDDDGNGFIDDINGWNFVPLSGGNNDVSDVNGHGTHVAGIASAVANNGVGVASIGYSCKLMVLRTGDSDGGFFTSDVADAVEYAVDNGATVINMSVGGATDSEDPVFEQSLEYAYAAGVPVVVSSGNGQPPYNIENAGDADGDGDNEFIVPAVYPTVITVGGLTLNSQTDAIEYGDYSNYGDSVDISAPGTDMYSTDYSTIFGSTYSYNTGTSMASPYVAGVIGLLKSVYPNTTSTNIYTAITSTALDLNAAGKDIYTGYGMIQPREALISLDTAQSTANHNLVSNIESGSTFTVTINVTDTQSSPIVPLTDIIYRFDDQGAWTTTSLEKSGNEYSVTITSSGDKTTFNYYFSIEDANPSFNYSFPSGGASNAYSASVTDGTGPTITFDYEANDFLSTDHEFVAGIEDVSSIVTTSIEVTITGTSMSETINSNHAGFSWDNETLTIDLSTITFSSDTSFSFGVEASDNKGNSSSQNITLQANVASQLAIHGPQGDGSPVLNVPNPFNPDDNGTRFAFQINKQAIVSIDIYSLDYRLVHQTQQSLYAGYHEISWDGIYQGQKLPAGVYFAIIKADASGETAIKNVKAVIKHW